MSLEAVIFSQGPNFGNYNTGKDLCNLLGFGGTSNWVYDLSLEDQVDHKVSFPSHHHFLENRTENPNCEWLPHFSEWLPLPNSPSDTHNTNSGYQTPPPTTTARRKRRRSRSKKNMEDIENQRRTHIAVERNRRKQMNEYLSVLRSLMPQSYVQRGDQASIVGGAINFVKELEHKLHLLGVNNNHNETKEQPDGGDAAAPPFSEFFTFPQYTMSSSSCHGDDSSATQSGVADIEVTMADSHANLRIRTKRRPKQILKVVSGLQSLRLTTLHLSVITRDQIVLCTLSLKVEDDCDLHSVDDIARAANDMLCSV